MRFAFVLSQVGQGLRRNLAMSVAVIIVTCVSLLFVGSAALAQIQINNLRDTWYGKIEISVSMCAKNDLSQGCDGKEATQEQINAVEELLKSDQLKPYIETVYFETKEEAYETFKNLMGSDGVYQYVTADMMPASFRIKLVDPEKYRVVVEELQGREGVAQVIDQKKILEKLFSGLNQATMLSIGLAVAMIIAAVLLITTTIRLSAMSREKETSIMRLVGASNLFVQLPFMIEGAIAATIGALGAVAVLWGTVKFLVGDWLESLSSTVRVVSTRDVWLISPVLVLAAIVLAVIASAASLNRYTRV
ncbi:MAG: permease-like cell division protein FtsX [Mobiluncus porci]|uniref:Cell division protein FtsX n=1 Tax=Mobiluncus porci TaxID=2652278 RepID=A0A7K0K1V7_9ACTO|nr:MULTISPECIES: permease-like cell division protein FtsX [Mobiluncus]MCI6584452.1 permease-like cell division protein FtsX [Mobiluncus sp.]MDD7542453.1 permease-like cell division protein FtsX [Mobiluncus porci]MDY5747761.1 permease-like cell division protein FtsX [Mobiluncus porci]MST49476.1 ABC transporter permease [Mobiluncus porci]